MPPPSPSAHEIARLALQAVDRIPAMIAFWDQDEVCRFANEAYLAWFGRTREQMLGITLRELLGPLYELNRPYIKGALAGEPQFFERSIPTPHGTRDSIATYTPAVEGGVVQGFFVHVADATPLKETERALRAVIAERDAAAAKVRTLEALLPICAGCRRIRDSDEAWLGFEAYVAKRTDSRFSHGICPDCLERLYPGE